MVRGSLALFNALLIDDHYIERGVVHDRQGLQGVVTPSRSVVGPENAQASAASMTSSLDMMTIASGRFDPSLPLAFAIARCVGLAIEEIFTPDGA